MTQHLTEKLIKLDELAEATGRSPDWLKRNHRRLALEGMPERCALGWAWPRALTEAWLLQRQSAPRPGNDNGNGVDVAGRIHAARVQSDKAALRALYGRAGK